MSAGGRGATRTLGRRRSTPSLPWRTGVPHARLPRRIPSISGEYRSARSLGVREDTSMSAIVLYTAAEVAEILRLHPQVVQRKLQAGEIPGYRIGREWRVGEQQLKDWLE